MYLSQLSLIVLLIWGCENNPGIIKWDLNIIRLFGVKIANSHVRSSPSLTMNEIVTGFPDYLRPVAMEVKRRK